MNEFGALLECYWWGTWWSCRKTCPSATLSITNPAYIGLELRLATEPWHGHFTLQNNDDDDDDDDDDDATEKLSYWHEINLLHKLYSSPPQMSTKRRFLHAMQCMYLGHEACSVVSNCTLDKWSEVNHKWQSLENRQSCLNHHLMQS